MPLPAEKTSTWYEAGWRSSELLIRSHCLKNICRDVKMNAESQVWEFMRGTFILKKTRCSPRINKSRITLGLFEMRSSTLDKAVFF